MALELRDRLLIPCSHGRAVASVCLLLTQSGHWQLRIAAAQTDRAPYFVGHKSLL
jgi:hypothetical protein